MKTKLFSIALIVSVLFAFQGYKEKAQHNNTKWSVKVSQSFLSRFPSPDSIHWAGQHGNSFSWQAGYIMFAMEKMWHRTGDSSYFNYIKKFVDLHVDNQGNVPYFSRNALDNFLPGYAIIFMYGQTNDEKYKIAATKIREGFNNYPRTFDSLYWHGDWAPHQVWVDGLFMGQMFLVRYGKMIGDSLFAFNEVVRQMTLIAGKCQMENGLLLHGWDESKKASWAEKKTGLAPEVWSEGLGWYAVLIADVFDYLPQNYPGSQKILEIGKKLCKGLKEVQDSTTGMWFQVVNKPYHNGNWNETSGTGMFIYLLQKYINKGFINKQEFQPVVNKAYQGLIKKIKYNKQGYIDLIDCSSIGIKDSYFDYISQTKEISPFSAFGSFIIGSLIVEFK